MPFCEFCVCCRNKSTRYRLISVTITSIFLLILGGAIFSIYNAVFVAVLKQQTELREGTLLYPEWVEPTQTVYVGFFLMNITNAEEFASQTPEKYVKPVLDRKGPFVYRTTIKKDGLTPLDDLSPKQIAFRQTFNFFYVPEKTVGSEDDLITTINFIALALGPTLDHLFNLPEAEEISEVTKRAAYRAVNSAITNTNSTLLLKYSAGDILFGFRDPLYTAVYDRLKGILEGTGLEDKLPPNDELGIFKILNGSIGWHTYQTYTGDPEYWLTNTITTLDGKEKLDYWFGDKCNMLNGSDGTVRPPFATREELVYHLYPSACRSTYVKYVKDTTVKRVPAWEYRPPPEMFKAPSNSSYNECFCQKGSKELYCNVDGGIYLGRCAFGVPLYITAPHFLNGDGYFLSLLEGMEQPNTEDHETVYTYEPNTGAAIAASKKLQFNLYVQWNDNIDISQKINTTFAFPILWLNGTYVVNDDDANLLYGIFVISAIVIIILQVLLLVLGVGLLSYACYYYFIIIRGSRSHSFLPEEIKYNEKHERVPEFINGAYFAQSELSGEETKEDEENL